MGDMFRSEEMVLCQLFIQPEAAYSSVSMLGEKGVVQFRDLNEEVSAFQRKFVGEVRRCDEMERKLRYIEAELNKDGVRIPDAADIPKAPNPREIIDLETRLDRTETEILELSANYVNLQANYLELTELRHVLEKTLVFFTEQEEEAKTFANDDTANRARLGFVAGVVQRERVPAFERMLWRISRGNVFLRQANIDTPLLDPSTRNEIFKNVFVAFYQGEELKARLQKVCAGFHANVYPCPSSEIERNEMLKGVRTRLEDLNMVLNQTQDHRNRVLTAVAKELQVWSVMVRKMKAIYHTLNLFNLDVTKKCLIGECWAPVAELQVVRDALVEGGRASGSSINSFLNVIETRESPPTYNRTNKFTYAFQVIIDSYGVSTYREVNPALYTIISFPFLFAVMFGDAGHGLILTSFAAILCILEKKLGKKKIKNEIGAIFFGGRYIILLMGIFSIYTGLIYNDVFSKSLKIFDSGWSVNYNRSTIAGNKDLTLDPAYDDYSGSPYPFGLDPIWQLATANKIIFMNSVKMKLSILLGVIHMIFGICLGVVNHVHFNRKANILLEFIPQLVFMLLLFLYLAILIFMKWIIYDPKSDESWRRAGCAPSVLIIFINMILFGSTEVAPDCKEYMYDGQYEVQIAFVLIAVVMIPIMLFGKPLYIICSRKKSKHPPAVARNNGDVNAAETAAANKLHDEDEDEDEHESFGEIMIHQGIHTIEYVLSTISHTASYLRLWALSLAHAQLSDVLWTMVMSIGMTWGDWVGAPIIFIIFAIWAALTVSILVLMEGLSAFLHTLRLHWVEFMSKFFEGSGYIFQPFSFKSAIDGDDGEDD